jgi:hypothetical protein
MKGESTMYKFLAGLFTLIGIILCLTIVGIPAGIVSLFIAGVFKLMDRNLNPPPTIIKQREDGTMEVIQEKRRMLQPKKELTPEDVGKRLMIAAGIIALIMFYIEYVH